VRLHVEPVASWAATVASSLDGWLGARARPRIGLATGTTVEPVYHRLAPLLVADATIFLLDEYGGLPADDPGRCAAMLRRGLLDRVGVSNGRFCCPDVDAADLDDACERYDARIADGGLDLVVLGLGVNGHVGLNEPGSGPDTVTRVVTLTEESRRASLQYGVAVAPSWGITVGMRTLLMAREIWLLVTGRHKRAVLDRVLNGPVTPDLPASLLRTHARVTCWTDADALPRLSRR
jgi:glucosamine-6-phosphate deaminase